MALTQISTNGIKDATIATADIADDAVTSAKIADDAITSALIADDAITSALIADDAITSALIADDAIVAAAIADNAVVTAAINADAVTGAKIADDAIGAEHIEVLDAALQFGDNVKAQIGTGNDLEIFHDGSHSYIDNSTGELQIRTAYLRIRAKDDGEDIATFNDDGAIELYHDGTKKLETASTGVQITGYLGFESTGKVIHLADSREAVFGTGEDLKIYHDGSNSFIDDTGTGDLKIRTYNGNGIQLISGSTENMITCATDGAVELYYDNSLKLETTSYGVFVGGTFRADVIDMQDNKKANWGNDDDLEIYHDGSNSFIKDSGTGALWVYASNFNVGSADGSEAILKGAENGAVDLYYNGTLKATTYADGFRVNGDFWIDNQTNTGKDIWFDESANYLKFYDDVKASFGNADDLQIHHQSSYPRNVIESNGCDLVINATSTGGTNEKGIAVAQNGNVELYYDNSLSAATTSTGFDVVGYIGAGPSAGTSTYHDFRTTNNNNWSFAIRHATTSSNPHGLWIGYTGATPDDTSHPFIQCDDSTTNRFRVNSDGDVQNHDNSYGSISDVKLKENIVDAGSQWDDIKAIKVRNFNFKTNKSRKLLGVVAQELETTSPGLVVETADKDSDLNDLGTTTKSVKYSILYMKAFKALQEAMVKIETLETKVAALEAA